MEIERQEWPNNRRHIIIVHPGIGSITIDSYSEGPAFISFLYVQEQYRNKGYGTDLLKKAEEIIKELNIDSVELWISKGMSISYAYKWYVKNGYKPISDINEDSVCMIKYLKEYA